MILVNLRLKFHAHFLDNNSGIKTFLFPTLPAKTCCQLCITVSVFLQCCFSKKTNNKPKPTIPQSKRAHSYTSKWVTETGEMSHKEMEDSAYLPGSRNPAILPICRLRIMAVTSNYFDAATKPRNAIL